MSKRIKKTRVVQKTLSEKDLKNTHFVPMKRMKEVLSFIGVPPVQQTQKIRCSYNLIHLKHERSNREYFDEVFERYSSVRHNVLLISSCYKALYAHDWDRLLYILKRVPKWRIKDMRVFYMRVLSILLMYHPDSQKNGFLNEYLHMVWGCRTDVDKKAIQKAILSLTRQMHRTTQLQNACAGQREERKKAFSEMIEQKNSDI